MSDVTMTPTSPSNDAPRRSSPLQWVRVNLFSSVSNTIQTIVFTAITLGLLRALLGQVFSEEADWTSVSTNLRLLMIYNYPADQIIRIWVSAAVVLLAAGLSLGAEGRTRLHRRPTRTAPRRSRTVLFGDPPSVASARPDTVRTWLIIIGVVSLFGGCRGELTPTATVSWVSVRC